MTELSTLAVATVKRRYDKATRPEQGRRISVNDWTTGSAGSVTFSVFAQTTKENFGRKSMRNPSPGRSVSLYVKSEVDECRNVSVMPAYTYPVTHIQSHTHTQSHTYPVIHTYPVAHTHIQSHTHIPRHTHTHTQ